LVKVADASVESPKSTSNEAEPPKNIKDFILTDIVLGPAYKSPLENQDSFEPLDVQTTNVLTSYLSFLALFAIAIITIFKMLRNKKQQFKEQNDNSLLLSDKNQFEMSFIDEEKKKENEILKN
jgi:hypothetical protein